MTDREPTAEDIEKFWKSGKSSFAEDWVATEDEVLRTPAQFEEDLSDSSRSYEDILFS